MDEVPELRHLVLAQRLGGEQEQGPRRRVLGDRLEDRHRVAQRLARRGRRDDDDVLPRVDRLDRLGLVDVRPLDAAPGEPGPDPGIEPVGPVAVDRLARGDDLVVEDATGERRLLEQLVEDGSGRGGGVRAHAGSRAANRTHDRIAPKSTRPCDRGVTARVSRPRAAAMSRHVNRSSGCRLTTGIGRSYPRADVAIPQAPHARTLLPPTRPPRRRRRRRTRPPRCPSRSLADLPVAGLTRRRIALLLGALVAAWVIVLFARQVSEASEASTRADEMRSQNEVLAANVIGARGRAGPHPAPGLHRAAGARVPARGTARAAVHPRRRRPAARVRRARHGRHPPRREPRRRDAARVVARPPVRRIGRPVGPHEPARAVRAPHARTDLLAGPRAAIRRLDRPARPYAARTPGTVMASAHARPGHVGRLALRA